MLSLCTPGWNYVKITKIKITFFFIIYQNTTDKKGLYTNETQE